jgi:hypothetical protein
MDTHHSKQHQNERQKVNFYEVDSLSGCSSKEDEIEESTGSLKEEYMEQLIEEKPHSSSNQHLSIKTTSSRDGDIESKESSKQTFVKSQGNGGGYATPVQEEFEEDNKSFNSKKESLSSHNNQLSSSEHESTPKNRQPFLDEKYRRNVLKINTILKKTPSSMAMIAKNYLNKQKNNPLRNSQPNPIPQPPLKDKQNLYDYGTSNQKYGLPTQNTVRPAVNKSLENLPRKDNQYNDDYGAPKDQRYQQPFSDPNKQGLLLSEHPFNTLNSRTENPNDSKDTFRRSLNHDNANIDWSTSPIYLEYMDDGITKYNEKKHQLFFEEQEINDVFKLLKTRYAYTNDNRKVEPMFNKAMDTLGDLHKW